VKHRTLFVTRGALLAAVCLVGACQSTSPRTRVIAGGAAVSPSARSPDDETVYLTRKHLTRARNSDGSVNAIIEIPAGTNAKFELKDIHELEARYPAALEIIELWFTAYKGPGITECRGWSNAADAERLLSRAIALYASARASEGTTQAK
jgi:hypothetical protein